MKYIRLAEITSILVLAGLIALFLYRRDPAEKTAEEINTFYLSALEDSNRSLQSDLSFRKNFGLDAADYEYVVYYGPSNTMSVDEFLLIKVSDQSSFSSIEEAVSDRILAQKTIFEAYGVDQYDRLMRAKTYETGSYYIFIISDDSDRDLSLVRKELGV